MRPAIVNRSAVISETVHGGMDRVTCHSPNNGWSVLHVLPFNNLKNRMP